MYVMLNRKQAKEKPNYLQEFLVCIDENFAMKKTSKIQAMNQIIPKHAHQQFHGHVLRKNLENFNMN